MSKNIFIPELRFPEFEKDGEWEEKKLGNLGQFLGGGTPNRSNSDYWVGDIPWISSSDISENNIHEISITRFINQNAVKQSATKKIPKGSILFVSRVGVGKLAINKEVLCTSQDFTSFIPNSILNYFLGYFFSANKHLLQSLNQGTSIKGFSKSDLENFELTFPQNTQEQQKIASCLSSLDELIAAHEDKLQALKDHKKGLMQNLFPQEGEKVPRYRFKEFEKDGEWVEKKLGDFISSLDAGVSVNSGDRPAQSTEIGVLKTSCVKDGVFDYLENKIVYKSKEIQRVREPVQSNTIIISRMNTPALVGANAFVDKTYSNIFLPDRLWAAKSNRKGDMKFISILLRSDDGRVRLSGLAKGSSGSMKNITKSDVISFSIVVPDVSEQQKIASCLSAVDDLITAQAAKIEQLKLHKKGLMQGLFPVQIERR